MSSRSILLEALRAVLVLALLFLNFAHRPASFEPAAQAGPLTLALTSDFCGDAPEGTPADHAPCHACRIGAAADLPPAPAALHTPCSIAAVRYGALPVLVLPGEAAGPHSARGPPRIA